MQEILAIALQAMHNDMTRLDSIAMNMANATTPGYKREVVAVRPFGEILDGLTGNSPVVAGSSAGVTAARVVMETDRRPGTLKFTGQKLDLALGGTGFFEIETPQGPAYTRQGNFRLDARGRLVTPQGYPVMGKGGEIYLNGSSPAVDERGQVFENLQGLAGGSPPGASPVAQLKIVEFEPTARFDRIGDGLVSAGSDGLVVDDKNIQIRQGYVENSNVNSMHEMVDLMQTMRHFESMQKVAAGYDDMMGTAIRKLGDSA